MEVIQRWLCASDMVGASKEVVLATDFDSLAARHARAIEALKPIAALDIAHFGSHRDEWILWATQDTVLTLGHVRAARAVLEETP